MLEIFKIIELLEKNELYQFADSFQNSLIKIAAWPYNLAPLDSLPFEARNAPWSQNEEDYKQYDNIFWKELKQRIPDYRNLKTDPDEENNIEGEMHGPDPTPGPAYVYPEGTNTSPSMAGQLYDFEWEVARDSNTGPEQWKNLLPRY